MFLSFLPPCGGSQAILLLYYTFAITLLSTTLPWLLFYWPHNALESITLRL